MIADAGIAPAAVRDRIAQLKRQRDRLHGEGEALVQGFRAAFPTSPLYLVRYSDRTLTVYRWRRSSASLWRGAGPKGVNLSVDLSAPLVDADLLAKLGPTLPLFLDYERRRVEINAVIACTLYEINRLNDLLDRRARLRQLAR